MNSKSVTHTAPKHRVLVVGGGGYIGSHVCLDLKAKGYEPFIVDNFVTGNRDLAQRLELPLYEGDIGDCAFIGKVLDECKPDSVMHFAAFASVGESVQHPDRYYSNNVVKTLMLLDEMTKRGVKKFIFSSTCATYGTPKTVPISETTPQDPINPYGRSKLFVEGILKDYGLAFGLQFVIFRYFNAAGAEESGLVGERHDPETHIIPLVLYTALGKGSVSVFGTDYDTPDGTCIRDYIHVSDISQAHILGLEYLMKGGASDAFNIGNGEGYSVKEVIASAEKITGKSIPFSISPRRAGDPPRLVADASKLKTVLGWKPQFPNLDDIIKTAWEWHRKDK